MCSGCKEFVGKYDNAVFCGVEVSGIDGISAKFTEVQCERCE